jgi:hypothetical protein
MRRNFMPYLSPINRLRLELDEIWPPGAQIAAFEGKKMFVGIFRVMPPELSGGSADDPHFDALPRQICSLDAQIAARSFDGTDPLPACRRKPMFFEFFIFIQSTGICSRRIWVADDAPSRGIV